MPSDKRHIGSGSGRTKRQIHGLLRRLNLAKLKLLAVLVEAGYPPGATTTALNGMLSALCPCEREDVDICTCGRLGKPITDEELVDAF